MKLVKLIEKIYGRNIYDWLSLLIIIGIKLVFRWFYMRLYMGKSVDHLICWDDEREKRILGRKIMYHIMKIFLKLTTKPTLLDCFSIFT